jgi:hypothetical protein
MYMMLYGVSFFTSGVARKLRWIRLFMFVQGIEFLLYVGPKVGIYIDRGIRSH